MHGASGGGLEASDAELLWPPEGIQPIIDGLNDAVVVADGSNHILFANYATEALLGWDRRELRGSPVVRLIPERLREAHVRGFARFLAGGEPRLIGRPTRVPVLRADGTELSVDLVITTLDLRDGGRLLVGTIRDVSDRLDVERQGQVAESLLEILAQGSAGEDIVPRLLATIGETLDWQVAALWAVQPDGTLRCRHLWQPPDRSFARFADASFAAPLEPGRGLPGRVLSTRAPAWLVDPDRDLSPLRASAAGADGLRSGFAFPVRDHERVLGVIELFAADRREPNPALLRDMVTIGGRLGEFLNRVAAEQEREQLLADLELARQTYEFLLQANRVLAEAADYRQTLQRLAMVAVPVLGDLCLIDVVDQDGVVDRMAACHADPAQQELVDELERSYPSDPQGTHPSIEVMRTGRSSWSPDMSEQFLRETTRDQHHLELVTELGFASYISVPLMASERTLGAVTLVSAGSGRRFSAKDLALAEELAAQVAAVVDKARVLDIEHRIAHTLQRSLLPARLPEVGGVSAAARYLPWTDGAEIGGDWYDLVPLSGGRVGVMVGDVEGHDMTAASVMGQVRNALRAYVLEDHGPAEALARLDVFSISLKMDRMATVVCAVLDPADGNLVVASAGHHAPVVVSSGGDASVLPVRPGPPIGVGRTGCPELRGSLPLRSALVLFTDGLVEDRTTSAEVGVARLMAAARPMGSDPETLCSAFERAIPAASGREDDIAMLVVRRDPPPA